MSSDKPRVSYHFMMVFTIVVGVLGIAILFLPDFDLLSIVLSCAVLGGLIGGSSSYEAHNRQRLQQSYKPAFEWLLLVLLVAFGFNAGSEWFSLGEVLVIFINSHWPSLIVSTMCILLGLAGLRMELTEVNQGSV